MASMCPWGRAGSSSSTAVGMAVSIFFVSAFVILFLSRKTFQVQTELLNEIMFKSSYYLGKYPAQFIRCMRLQNIAVKCMTGT